MGCQRRVNLTARSTNRSSITVVVVTENHDSLKNKSFVAPPISQPVVAVPFLRMDRLGLPIQFQRDLVIPGTEARRQ
jgi:hypothetical protein